MKEQFLLKPVHIYSAIILGTIVRIFYGIQSQNWLTSPDQIAWQLSLDTAMQNGLSYKNLIHYPHEGGSFFIGLLALLFKPVGNILPPLTWAALVIDILSRIIQIKLTQLIFGSVTAGWFAIWTILSVPVIIPWATVNFGLHGLTAFIPFVFLYYLTTKKTRLPLGIMCGIITGVAISISYNNIIFIPAFILYQSTKSVSFKMYLKTCSYYIASTILLLIPHICTRLFLDSGFNLEHSAMYTIRGEGEMPVITSEHLKNFFISWHRVLPASFLLSSIQFLNAYVQRDIIFCFLLLSAAGIIFYKKIRISPLFASLLLIGIFVLLYAFSPFYSDEINKTSYVYYRHFSYIIPLTVLIMLFVFTSLPKAGLLIATLFIIVCGFATIQQITNAEKPAQENYRAAGWVLAQKYGDDTDQLMQLYAQTPPGHQQEIMIGFGWGLAAVLFKDNTKQNTSNILTTILQEFPEQHQSELMEGVRYAFSAGITPKLDNELLDEVIIIMNNN